MRVTVTPHVGASTMEAQEGVAIEIAEAVIGVLKGELAAAAVSAPMVLANMNRGSEFLKTPRYAAPTCLVCNVEENDHQCSLEFYPFWLRLLLRQVDQPGMIGRVGSILGEKIINVSVMSVGRIAPRKQAVMTIGVDDQSSKETLKKIEDIPAIEEFVFLKL
ncbi:uncharacterized protein J3R85_008047 [Psidium guajava]|nr:uncharacterized protein J3R85_008047 [Psidium guajava]